MTDDLPSIAQISKAEPYLYAAHNVAAEYAKHGEVAANRLATVTFISNVRSAARALGLELVRRDGPRVVVDNTAEPNTMREVK